ncbi:MAG: hypothetical protein KDI82_17810, partial [Gammaproteobacteria bacterium]|nr:hypothetical protein [Gammaproteobacteria bacterium]
FSLTRGRTAGQLTRNLDFGFPMQNFSPGTRICVDFIQLVSHLPTLQAEPDFSPHRPREN